MKFALGSDLHLYYEGYDKLPVNADANVLVLAGDIMEVELLKISGNRRDRLVSYLEQLNNNFEHILYVMGNHEHYGNVFKHTVPNMRDRLSKFGLNNFKVLENQIYEIEDVSFYCATMWTTMKNRDPLVINACKSYMNDYNQIFKFHDSDGYYTEMLKPNDTAHECEITKLKLKEHWNTDKKKVLVTHHAPCSLSCDPRYTKTEVSYAYYEELGDILFDTNIQVAVHGHMHHKQEYLVGNTRVYSNPRGYFSYESSADEFDFKVIEV